MQLDIREILCQVIKVVSLIKNSMQNRSKIIGNLNLKSSFTFPVCNRSNHQNSKKNPIEKSPYHYNRIPIHSLKIFTLHDMTKIMKDFNLQVSYSLTSFLAYNVKPLQFII